MGIEKISDSSDFQPLPTDQVEEAEAEQVQTAEEKSETLAEAMQHAATVLGARDVASTDVLNSILSMFSKMTTTIQQMAMTQADQLQFQTEMQNLYTTLMSKVPIYDTTTHLPPDWNAKDDDQTKIQKVNLANSNNAIITDRLRNLRDMCGDNAKQIQAGLNTSVDAQKNMLDFMQTLVQQLRDWSSNIYR